MNNIEKNLWLITLPKMALGLFITFNIFAMFFYPGSTYLNYLSTGYSFTQKFLSDLGRTFTFSGEVNFLSSRLFNISLILAGSVFSLFYLHVRKVFNIENQRAPAFIGSYFGLQGGLSMMGVGLTPSDLYLEIHIVCATWLFRFFFIASLCYSIVIFRYIVKWENC